MSYNYEKSKPRLFSDDGQRFFMEVYRKTMGLLGKAGAVRIESVMHNLSGSYSTDDLLACFDRMVELQELEEATDSTKVWAQHRVFIKQERSA